MKTRIFLGALLFLGLLWNIASGQTRTGDEIVGTWTMETGESKIRVYKQNGAFFGKMVWSKDMYEADGKTSRKDINNANVNLRDRFLKDLTILEHFRFDKDEWSDGRIYDIKSGKTYSCTIKLKNPDVMLVRGYIGISLLGKTVSFNRVK